MSSMHAGAASLAAGSLQADFNNDGFVDVAIGAPLEDVGSIVDAGSVNVLYGSASGLAGAGGSQQFWQGTGGVVGAAEAGDGFGPPWLLATSTTTALLSSSSGRRSSRSAPSLPLG